MAVEYKASSELTRRALIQSGLSEGQATIYEALIHYGPQKATKLAFLAGIPRTFSYKLLEELQGLGLVTREDSKKVTVFSPAHPLKLKEVLDRRQEELEKAQMAINKLISDFTTLLGTKFETDLYTKVATYAGKACLGPLSATERADMQKALEDLLGNLRK